VSIGVNKARKSALHLASSIDTAVKLALMPSCYTGRQEGIRALTVPFFRPLPAPSRVANPMIQVIFQTTSKDGNDRMLEQP